MTAFSIISQEAKIEAAMKMAVVDALELQGEVSKNDLIAYMSSEKFKAVVQNYLAQM